MALKRYAVFGGEDYYPAGGMFDYVGSSDSLNEAKEMKRKFLAAEPDRVEYRWSRIHDLNSDDPTSCLSEDAGS